MLSYESHPWLKRYIERNADLRARAESDFERELWKLANNSVFGKQIENVRKRVNVKLVSDEKKLKKIVHKHNFKNLVELETNGKLTLVEMGLKEIKLNKAIYGGLVILDKSKVEMQDFYFNYIQKKFGNRQTLLMTDTDSLILEIESKDFYEEIAPDVHKWFDTSNLPSHLPLDVGVNRKVIGKFKDETKGRAIHEFVGVAPKQYSLRYEDTTIKKCKGITKGALKGPTKDKEITFEDYRRALDPNTKSKTVDMKIIRSRKHNLYTETIQKTVFNPKGVVINKPKRKILEDNINTLPWGHYKLKEEEIVEEVDVDTLLREADTLLETSDTDTEESSSDTETEESSSSDTD